MSQIVVPFGKHKGRSVEELLDTDPAYLQWLANQDWFRTKYVSLHQVIINQGAPAETPEHNAMQVRFLDDAFCVRFLYCYRPNLMAEARRKLASEWAGREFRKGNSDDAWWRLSEKDQEAKTIPYIDRLGPVEFCIKREFEVRGVDVILAVTAHCPPHDFRAGLSLADYSYELPIELKPTVGDDYPAVLRQMKHNKSRALLIGKYAGVGATREQFVQTFATASIKVVFASAVE